MELIKQKFLNKVFIIDLYKNVDLYAFTKFSTFKKFRIFVVAKQNLNYEKPENIYVL